MLNLVVVNGERLYGLSLIDFYEWIKGQVSQKHFQRMQNQSHHIVKALAEWGGGGGKPGIPGKMRQLFPVREKSGNFEKISKSQGKVREFLMSQGKVRENCDSKIKI